MKVEETGNRELNSFLIMYFSHKSWIAIYKSLEHFTKQLLSLQVSNYRRNLEDGKQITKEKKTN